MRKSRIFERLLVFFLIAAITLTMQVFPVWAGTEQPEDQAGISVPEQPENLLEQLGQVQSEIQPGTLALEESQRQIEVQADLPETEPVAAYYPLNDDILEYCTVPSQNPEGAIVNLFDYWQSGGPEPENEVPHDYVDDNNVVYTTFDSGISMGHLLRFGYRDNKCTTYCAKTDNGINLGDFGAWNQYYQDYNGIIYDPTKRGTPYQGIVKNRLDENGFPELNLSDKSLDQYGRYADTVNEKYLASAGESLAYLFSLEKGAYKDFHEDVKGLFQLKDGYYRYDSTENFASYDADSNSFILYNSPGVAIMSDGDSTKGEFCGQFFPFNEAKDVFDSYTPIGNQEYRLSYENQDNNDKEDYTPVEDSNGYGYKQCYLPELNHYLGMTLEVPFLQPAGGYLNNDHNDPMRFEFSGDDDVWIFIDDVLVADLGGLHDAYCLSIDFSTGIVEISNMEGSPYESHKLLQSFNKSLGNADNSNLSGFSGNTFADNTVHTLKMFYLERGHMASNLSLSFNLQIARYNQIKKVNQDGTPMNNVEFALYPAEAYNVNQSGRILCTSTVSGQNCYVEYNKNQTPLITFQTGTDGTADFIDQTSNSGYSFSHSSTNYYVLRETKAPAGYRSSPVDIVLEYNPDTATLSVANRWQTGAYASFTSYVNEWAGRGMSYGQYNAGFIVAGTDPVSESSRRDGLVLAVPLMQSKNEWFPLYGSNIEGFHTAGAVGSTADSMGMALLRAALYQCKYDEGWFLEWSDEKAGLEGKLSDLPGRADQYRHVNPNGQMRMIYIIIEPQALQDIGINKDTSIERYEALKAYVKEQGINNAVTAIYGTPASSDKPYTRNVNMLDTGQFMRVFRSLIYIPNEQRELRVQKVDKDGVPLAGATFRIYKTEQDAQQNGTNWVATGTTDDDGMLVFKPQGSGTGYAKMVWADAANTTYYLKEVSAPDGYRVNETVIPIVIGTYSVYADAGTVDDGVSVKAGVGKLCQTMSKYASDGDVDITLRDITAVAQMKNTNSFSTDEWVSDQCRMDLHYGLNCDEVKMDYGLHNGVTGEPFFTTDTGFLRTYVMQGSGQNYGETAGYANRDNLGDMDLTGMFSLLNVVVVEDAKSSSDQRELRVLKLNEEGTPLNGAVFGLYSSLDAAQNGGAASASGITANVNGQDGVLVFQTQTYNRDGFAQMDWVDGNTYYLKEISAPNGYNVNETIVTVIAESHSVYADAGNEEDEVAVMAGVGYLRREETNYADDNGVSPTLYDITAFAQGKTSEEFSSTQWQTIQDESGQTLEKDFHYGINRKMGMDYGLHDEVNDDPFFITETGFLRTGVKQTEKAKIEQYDSIVSVEWNDLNGQDLTEWFGQLNIVVVKNQKIQTPDDSPDVPPTENENPRQENGTSTNTDTGTGTNESSERFLDKLDKLADRMGVGIPQTGDDSLIWWWALLSIISLLGIGATVCNMILRKRKQNEDASKSKQKQRRSKKQ